MRSIIRIVLSACWICLTGVVFAQTREITNVAGNGTAGYSGDAGPATAATLNGPYGVTFDASGNVYIADRQNHRIRKVDAGSGIITTVAGSGSSGWFFTSGLAVNASLNLPSSVAVDAAGNIYIAEFIDNGISRIHKVTAATGVLSEIQPAVIIDGAVSIALDNSGNLYVAEQSGHRISRLSLQSGTVTTIAGTGVAGFSGDGGPATSAEVNAPSHLTIDSAGNLYFSDSLNNRIRKVAGGTGIITTVAGSGATGGPNDYGGDGGPATDAHLNNPRAVAVDSAGNLFIADTLNNRIRRVSAKTGIITTILTGELTGDECGSGRAPLKSVDNLVVNGAGNFLYITDVAGNHIWRVALSSASASPVLNSISPGSGIAGSVVDVVLTGTAFLGEMGLPAAPNCFLNGTTVSVSGAGVLVSDVTVTSNTSLRATFEISPDAESGLRDVTVRTDAGTSGPAPFWVLMPPPTLVSITPASAVAGSTLSVTLAGTYFDALTGTTALSVEGISVSDTRVSNPTSLTATFRIPADSALGVHLVRITTAGGTSNAVPFIVQPRPPTFVYEFPSMLNPTEQVPIKVALANPEPNVVTAQLKLTFVPNAATGSDDPNVMFINNQSSTRTVDVMFPANSASAQLSLPDGVLKAGTVAGTIELSMANVAVSGVGVTDQGNGFDVQVPRLVPIITSVRILNLSASRFDVEITGYSTSREISAATFSFAAASGANLVTVQLQPEVTTTFRTYYQSGTSAPVGGSFVYTQPFTIRQGDVNAVATVSVILTNAQGTSEPQTISIR